MGHPREDIHLCCFQLCQWYEPRKGASTGTVSKASLSTFRWRSGKQGVCQAVCRTGVEGGKGQGSNTGHEDIRKTSRRAQSPETHVVRGQLTFQSICDWQLCRDLPSTPCLEGCRSYLCNAENKKAWTLAVPTTGVDEGGFLFVSRPKHILSAFQNTQIATRNILLDSQVVMWCSSIQKLIGSYWIFKKTKNPVSLFWHLLFFFCYLLRI